MADISPIDLGKMRSDIYQQLQKAYMEHPETMSPGAKALLAILATTKYMDDYDAKGDMFADMARRVDAAEKLMDEIQAGTYNGPGEPSNIIGQLVPIEMVETAQQYTYLDDLRVRMIAVLDRNILFGLNQYEKERGLPLSEPWFPKAPPWYPNATYDSSDTTSDDEAFDLLGED